MFCCSYALRCCGRRLCGFCKYLCLWKVILSDDFLFVLLASFCYNEITFSIDELRFYRDSEKR